MDVASESVTAESLSTDPQNETCCMVLGRAVGEVRLRPIAPDVWSLMDWRFEHVLDLHAGVDKRIEGRAHEVATDLLTPPHRRALGRAAVWSGIVGDPRRDGHGWGLEELPEAVCRRLVSVQLG